MTNSDRYFYTDAPLERGFLVGVDIRSHRFQSGVLDAEDSIEELGALAETADVNVLGGTIQRLNKPNSATLIGSGKVEELQNYRDEMSVDVFIFDNELSPRQQKNLEQALTVKVVDRTALILDIFARHARTKEGQLQVELAQLEYRLPRLTRMWTHLARQAGGRAGGASGGVGVRGPGETQLEVDRREIGRKIASLKKDLEKVRARRARHRQRRRKGNVAVVAIVGYTNAGKSTLLNQLMQMTDVEASEPIYTADQLFATLDPTTRRIKLPQGQEILFSDTVGFIQKLPTQLVAAFRATLEELAEADLLLHVVDISHPNASEHVQVVEETLRALNATHIPVVTVLNKMDLFQGDIEDLEQKIHYNDSIAISAKTGYGIPALLEGIEAQLFSDTVELSLLIPYSAGNILAMLHEQANVQSETHDENGTIVIARIPIELKKQFEAYRTDKI